MVVRLALALALAAVCALSQDTAALFNERVLPVLRKECFGCHGEGQALAKLDLRSREGMLRGGSRGPSVVPGAADKSLLFTAISGADPKLRMPPGGPEKALPSPAIAAIRDWINAGATWADQPAPAAAQVGWNNYREEDLWAFRPLRKQFDQQSLDGFINAKLAAKGLRAALRADRLTLIRRATIDLTGLPPTPEEVQAFLNDRSAEAWPRLVDRLLASPRYGERQARHWLDVTRYADSGGYSNDFERPNAWRYRDYVIRAFNNDKPYDRFVREQIAGDELYPDDAEAWIATGFLRSGPWEHTGMAVEAVTRQMFLDDVTNSVGVTFLGLTVGCARCHDHKFDPIPTKDYYRLQAVFASTEFVRAKLPFLPSETIPNRDAGRERVRRMYELNEAGLRSFDDQIKAALMKKHGVSRIDDVPAAELKEALQTKKLLSGDQFEHFKLYQKHGQIYRDSLDRYEPKVFAVSSGPRDGETDGGLNLRYPKRADYKAAPVHILAGGNITSPGERVNPGVPGLVERYAGLAAPDVPEDVVGRRAALAKWITDPANPLTARVMVNRVWQWHFGRALAADPNNLGKSGRKPSHPELLDWLAQQFIASGWSVKALHRTIMLSEAYQRASDHPAMDTVRERDANNELLAYFSPRRMEAEVLRDSVLFAAGELNTEAGGPGTFPQINEDVARQPLHRMGSLAPAYLPSPRRADRNRRSIYMFQQRSLIDPFIEVFNGPTLDLSCERRDASTVPTQALTMINSQFMQDMALAMAARIAREASTTRAQVERAYLLSYGRKPQAREMELALGHIARMKLEHDKAPPPPRAAPKPIVHMITSELTGQRFEFTQQPDPSPYEHNLHATEVPAHTRALADLCLTILNTNEFVYVY